MALPISCGGTSSVTSPRRDGLSIAPTSPRIPVSTNTNSTLITPATSQMPSTMACKAMSDWVTIVVRRRSNLSANAPAHAPNISIGRNCSAALIPRSTELPVNRYSKNEVAVSCNHEPMLENINPAKNKRAFRLLNERNMPPFFVWPSSVIEFECRDEYVARNFYATN